MAQQGPNMARRGPHDGPQAPPEAFQMVTLSLRAAMGSRMARGSPQRPLEGAEEASRRPQEAIKNFREPPKRLSKA
eukprot:5575253-Pyramimonas_sp.AAC.1